MRKENTSIRLKRIMQEKNLRQTDIINLIKPYSKQYNIRLEKNDLSQYVSGKVEPSQEKLSLLSLALDVSEAWLMGYDVARNNLEYDSTEEITNEYIIHLFSLLSLEEKKKIVAQIKAYIK